MHVDILESTVSDNRFYLVHDGEVAALIDPIDATTAIDAVERSGCSLSLVVNTHWHPDHVGGNDAVFAHFPDAMLCAGPDHALIHGSRSVSHVVQHGDVVTVGALEFDVIETPGHTAGHIALRRGDHLFSGDTIFVAGAGHCRFGGDPSVLFRTYRDVIGALPGDLVFYPGHDYARRNIEFALSLEPDLEPARELCARLDEPRSGLLLTKLSEERSYNPFFRFAEPALRESLLAAHGSLWERERAASADDDEATFRATRELRNSW